MMAPVEINLPSGLRIMMFPRQPRYKWWPFGKIDDGETEEELYARFAHAIRQVDFKSIADLYDPREFLQKRDEKRREVIRAGIAGLDTLFGQPKRGKKKSADILELTPAQEQA